MWKSTRYLREYDLCSIEWQYLEIKQANSVGMRSPSPFSAIYMCKLNKFMFIGLPAWLSSKEPVCNSGDVGLIPGGSPERRNGNPLQYSCLENPNDRGDWCVTVHGS